MLTVSHHDCEKFDNDFRGRPEENLSLAFLLCIVDALESVCKYVISDHPLELRLLGDDVELCIISAMIYAFW